MSLSDRNIRKKCDTCYKGVDKKFFWHARNERAFLLAKGQEKDSQSCHFSVTLREVELHKQNLEWEVADGTPGGGNSVSKAEGHMFWNGRCHCPHREASTRENEGKMMRILWGHGQGRPTLSAHPSVFVSLTQPSFWLKFCHLGQLEAKVS